MLRYAAAAFIALFSTIACQSPQDSVWDEPVDALTIEDPASRVTD